MKLYHFRTYFAIKSIRQNKNKGNVMAYPFKNLQEVHL